jgi:hypothetical protein
MESVIVAVKVPVVAANSSSPTKYENPQRLCGVGGFRYA